MIRTRVFSAERPTFRALVMCPDAIRSRFHWIAGPYVNAKGNTSIAMPISPLVMVTNNVTIIATYSRFPTLDDVTKLGRLRVNSGLYTWKRFSWPLWQDPICSWTISLLYLWSSGFRLSYRTIRVDTDVASPRVIQLIQGFPHFLGSSLPRHTSALTTCVSRVTYHSKTIVHVCWGSRETTPQSPWGTSSGTPRRKQRHYVAQ